MSSLACFLLVGLSLPLLGSKESDLKKEYRWVEWVDEEFRTMKMYQQLRPETPVGKALVLVLVKDEEVVEIVAGPTGDKVPHAGKLAAKLDTDKHCNKRGAFEYTCKMEQERSYSVRVCGNALLIAGLLGTGDQRFAGDEACSGMRQMFNRLAQPDAGSLPQPFQGHFRSMRAARRAASSRAVET